jgi:hypothetical protein
LRRFHRYFHSVTRFVILSNQINPSLSLQNASPEKVMVRKIAFRVRNPAGVGRRGADTGYARFHERAVNTGKAVSSPSLRRFATVSNL